MTQPTVIRLEPNGPAESGLQPCQTVVPSMVIDGTVVETAHNYVTSGSGKITAGVWECSAYTERLESYPVDQFCYVLKGSLVLTVDGEEPQTFHEGDAFMIQRGTKGIWHQPGTFREYYVMIEP